MATSPNLSIGSISNAVITDQGTSVSSGSISWSVAEQAESAFSATKANYNADTSGWSSRYYWSAKSGTTNFNGLTNTATVSTQVTVYTKSIVKSSSGTFVTSYSNASSAQTACDNVAGSSTYIYEYSYGNSPIDGNLGYCVYRYDLSISTSSSTVTLTQNVDVSNYITVQVTKPSPTYSLSYGTTSATASVSNLSYGDSVVFTIYAGASGLSIAGSASGTASGSSMNLSINGLTASTFYTAHVTVNGTSLGYNDFTTDTISQTYSTSYEENSVIVTVSNLNVGDTATLFLRKATDSTASEDSYIMSTSSDSSSVTWIKEVEYDVEYLYSIRVTKSDGMVIWLVSGEVFIIESPLGTYILSCDTKSVTVIVKGVTVDSTVEFEVVNINNGSVVGSDFDIADASGSVTLSVNGLDVGMEYIAHVYVNSSLVDGETSFVTLFDWWKTTVQRYMPINSWQNPANGSTHPAPVTAIEWNRLVSLVNNKCGTSIGNVSSGERMLAGFEKNIRLVADALGVVVDSGDIVTAQFFLDLRDAINAIIKGV